MRIPQPDGLLHIYALPVGQGDSHVIQCPSGELTIVDLGSSDDIAAGFWNVPELINFFTGQYNRIRNVVLSHNHYDHYVFLPDVLPATADLSGLQDIYISCQFPHLVAMIQQWLADTGLENNVRIFNRGNPCGPIVGQPCETINLCPSDPAISVNVLSANVGSQCVSGNKNIDSIVFEITYGSVQVVFNGDFEDFTSDWAEVGKPD